MRRNKIINQFVQLKHTVYLFKSGGNSSLLKPVMCTLGFFRRSHAHTCRCTCTHPVIALCNGGGLHAQSQSFTCAAEQPEVRHIQHPHRCCSIAKPSTCFGQLRNYVNLANFHAFFFFFFYPHPLLLFLHCEGKQTVSSRALSQPRLLGEHSISTVVKCCNSVMIFNMIASCVCSSILFFVSRECVCTEAARHCPQWTGPV